jgi:hypothetical protein
MLVQHRLALWQSSSHSEVALVPFLLCHIDFGPVVFVRTAQHAKQNHEENEATVHGVKSPRLGKRASGLRRSGC